jgi:hypothetical protein
MTWINSVGLVLIAVNEFVSDRLLHRRKARSVVGLFGESNRAVTVSIGGAHAVLSFHTGAGFEGYTIEVDERGRQRPLFTVDDGVCVPSRTL